MGLFEVQTAAYHGTNQSIWIDVNKICSVEQVGGKAVITFVGGSKISVTYFSSFKKFMDSLFEFLNDDESD